MLLFVFSSIFIKIEAIPIDSGICGWGRALVRALLWQGHQGGEPRHGAGPNLVVDLVEKAGLVLGSEVYVDNLFTSFPLLAEMSLEYSSKRIVGENEVIGGKAD